MIENKITTTLKLLKAEKGIGRNTGGESEVSDTNDPPKKTGRHQEPIRGAEPKRRACRFHQLHRGRPAVDRSGPRVYIRLGAPSQLRH